MRPVERPNGPEARSRLRTLVPAAACGLALVVAGCGAFNPAFVNVVTGGQGGSTITNPPGHVIVSMVNNAEFDERLVDYLAPLLNLTPDEIRRLRPRLRMRLLITFTDGSTNTVEMISGSRSVIEPGFDENAFPDLNQNDLFNVVVNCDVASVTLQPNTAVEVFVPVELTGFQLRESQGEGGQVITEWVASQTRAPQFLALQTDDVDEDGNVILRRNVGTRDGTTPATNVLCGTVIAFTVNGSLSVPFLDGVSQSPSFDVDNEPQVAGIGGRFSFRTSVQ